MPYVRTPEVLRRALVRERHWVYLGASTLAGVAGFVNVVLLGFFHVPISHMSGAVSRLSIDVAAVNMVDLKLVLGILLGFLFGAAFSGMVIGGSTLMPGRRYGVTLVVEGLLLALATLLLVNGNSTGVLLGSVACGMQNAMASSYYGLVIRTTHVTGIVTDIGVMIGHWLRHRSIKPWKLTLLCSILVSFFVGGTLGALVFTQLEMYALAIPSAGCFLAGITYYAWQRRHGHRQPDISGRKRKLSS